MGLSLEDFPPPANVQVWAENWPPLQLYLRNKTQWRVGAGGPVGLDYQVLYHDLDRRGVTGEDFDDVMDAIRVIESTVLSLHDGGGV
jgi:hypothetical protein